MLARNAVNLAPNLATERNLPNLARFLCASSTMSGFKINRPNELPQNIRSVALEASDENQHNSSWWMVHQIINMQSVVYSYEYVHKYERNFVENTTMTLMTAIFDQMQLLASHMPNVCCLRSAQVYGKHHAQEARKPTD